jgi:hypothetical protein
MFSIVIPHFAQSRKHIEILNVCVYFIRKTQPVNTPIHIVRNPNSRHDITSLDILTDPDIKIHVNPYPDAGEIGTLYWMSDNKGAIQTEYAILLHDSMRCIKSLENHIVHMKSNGVHVSHLWSFHKGFSYHLNEIRQCFDLIDANKANERTMQMMKFPKGWAGCFGCSMIISIERLCFYAKHAHLFAPIEIMKVKPYREAYERILGLMFNEFEPRILDVNGDIFTQPFMGVTNTGMEYVSYEELMKRFNGYIRDKDPSIIKIFVGR